MQAWLDRRDVLVDELSEALDQECWDTVGRIIDGYFFALAISAPAAVDEIWRRVPSDWLMANPRYLMAAAASNAINSPFPLPEDSANQLFGEWVSSDTPPIDRDVLGVKVAELRRHQALGHFDRATAIADEIQSIVREATNHNGFDDFLGVVFIGVGQAWLLAGDLVKSIGAFSEAWRWSVNTFPHPSAQYAAGHCALSHAVAGDFVRAEMWRERCGEQPPAEPRTMAYRLQCAAILADVLLAIGSSDESAARAAAGRIDETAESGDMWWVSIHARARIAFYWGDRVAAIHELVGALEAYPSLTGATSMAGMLLRSDLADLYQANGELDAADLVLSELDMQEPDEVVVGSAMRLRMLWGDNTGALSLLESARMRFPRAASAALWDVLNANILNVSQDPGTTDAVRRAANSISLTGAYDAVMEAVPEVRDAIGAIVALPEMGESPFAARSFVDLTPRESEILRMLGTYATVKDLAAALYISPNTAKSHLRRLYRKLGAQNRSQALRRSTQVLPRRSL